MVYWLSLGPEIWWCLWFGILAYICDVCTASKGYNFLALYKRVRVGD